MDNIILNQDSLWTKTKEFLRASLPDHAFNTWFDPINFITMHGNEMVLEVPNQFFYEWIESHYKNTIESTIFSNLNQKVTIKYTIAPEGQQKTETTPQNLINEQKKKEVSKPKLNEKYIFSSFIEGSNNQFAKAASMSVAEEPGQKSFNPLVIYGGVGLGKTHLLHAIGNHILFKSPEKNIVCASSEKFTHDFISSIQKNRTVEFSKFYRNADVLLIDDIQFFQGKEQTQEQFFHTFNELYQSGKQIVMTADRYPGEMVKLQDRLLSRFTSGVSVDIQPPDYETRVAILMEKAETNNLSLSYEIIEFIATHITKNIRELESSVIQLLARSSLFNKEIDMNLVRDAIKERVGNRIKTDISIEDIVRSVSQKTNISEREIVGTGRKKHVAETRQIAMYLTREIMSASLNTVGLYFGGRDHTTVLHACRTIEEKLKTDQRTKAVVHKVKSEFKSVFD